MLNSRQARQRSTRSSFKWRNLSCRLVGQTSGIGRTGGYAGFQAFSNPRTVAQRSRSTSCFDLPSSPRSSSSSPPCFVDSDT